MNTPAHIILGASVFARPGAYAVNVAAILGGLAPDFSLYFMVFWNRFWHGMSESQIFGEEYFSDYWQQVFAIDNSIPIWALILLFSLLIRYLPLIAFSATGLLHLLLDFPLHHDDGRAHFWPFSDWVFASPISYWDPSHYGSIVGGLELLVSLILLIVLWKRFASIIAKIFIVLLGAMEIVPTVLFPILFSFG